MNKWAKDNEMREAYYALLELGYDKCRALKTARRVSCPSKHLFWFDYNTNRTVIFSTDNKKFCEMSYCIWHPFSEFKEVFAL